MNNMKIFRFLQNKNVFKLQKQLIEIFFSKFIDIFFTYYFFQIKRLKCPIPLAIPDSLPLDSFE